MKKLIGAFLMLMVILAGSQVFAYTIGFGDSAIYWPNWSNSGTDINTPGGKTDNYTDVIGIPNITGGTATVSSTGYLTNLVFNVTGIDPSIVKAGDLFVDSNGDKKWDYVVNLLAGSGSGFTYGDNNLYSIGGSGLSLGNSTNLPTTNPGYTLSYYSGGTSGYRENSPVAFEGTTSNPLTKVNDTLILSGFSTTTGWSNSTTQTFNFGTPIQLTGSTFTIGWGEQCANDVIYETMNNPVPEPASMLLMGSGLIGLAGWGRRKFFKKETVVA